MLFNSAEFLLFLPIVVTLYYLLFDIQLSHYQKNSSLSESEDLELYMVYSPVRPYILKYPKSGTIDFLWLQTALGPHVHFLNFSRELPGITYYSDYVHLNSTGADVFSQRLREKIADNGK